MQLSRKAAEQELPLELLSRSPRPQWVSLPWKMQLKFFHLETFTHLFLISLAPKTKYWHPPKETLETLLTSHLMLVPLKLCFLKPYSSSLKVMKCMGQVGKTKQKPFKLYLRKSKSLLNRLTNKEPVLLCNSVQAPFLCLCKYWGLCSKSIPTKSFGNFTSYNFLEAIRYWTGKKHWRWKVLCSTFSTVQNCPQKIQTMLLHTPNTNFDTPLRTLSCYFHSQGLSIWL